MKLGGLVIRVDQMTPTYSTVESSFELRCKARDLLKGKSGDLIVSRVTVLTGIDDPYVFKIKILQCDMH